MTTARSGQSWPALLRFALAAAALASLASLYEAPAVGTFVPLFRAWLVVFDDTFETVDLALVRVNGEEVIRRTATPARAHVVGSAVVLPGAGVRLQHDGDAGLVLQPFVLGLALVLAPRWRRPLELSLRGLIAGPLLLAVVLLDVPVILCGLAWHTETSLLDPHRLSPLMAWGAMMNSGGRFALSAACAATAVIGAARLTRPRERAVAARSLDAQILRRETASPTRPRPASISASAPASGTGEMFNRPE